MESEKKQNFVKYMSNPRCFTLKRWFVELLQEKYPPDDTIIERIATSLSTDRDIEDFGKLIMEVYHKAYYRAVNDYKEQAEKMGLKIIIGTKSS